MLNVTTINELHIAFKTLNNKNNEVQVMVTGSGEKHLLQELIFLNLQIFSVQGSQLAAEGQEKLTT
jgi:enoyl-CoA hydratase